MEEEGEMIENMWNQNLGDGNLNSSEEGDGTSGSQDVFGVPLGAGAETGAGARTGGTKDIKQRLAPQTGITA